MNDPKHFNTGRWRCGGCDGWFEGKPPGTFKDPWLCGNCQELGRVDKRSAAVKRDIVARKILQQVWPA